MITIHEKTERQFQNLGLGALAPSLCVIKEELNGVFELEMEHPYDSLGKWNRLEKERILFASTPRGKQPFRIYHLSPGMENIKVYARHVFYDLLDNLCMSINTTQSPQGILDALKGACVLPMPFTFSTELTGSGTIYLQKENPVTALLSTAEDKRGFVGVFGGELLRDGFRVSMLASMGQDRGVAIRYGKNLIGLEVSEDISEVSTRIYGFGKGGVGMPGGFMDSKHIGAYLHPKIHIFEDSSLQGRELSGAVQALFDSGCDLPKINIKADFVSLAKTEAYKDYAILEEVKLGDVVTVSNVKMGFHKKAKVIAYHWDCLLEQYSEVELGDFVGDLTSSITSGAKSLVTAVGASTEVKQVHSLLSGRVTVNGDGLYICVDGSSTADAKKVFHFGSGGLRYASDGVHGSWKTVIDGNGMVV